MGRDAGRRRAAVTTEALARFLDEALGDRVPVSVQPITGGGSCEVFDVRRGPSRWVLRRAPRHASSSTAHDVLREFRILDAIKGQPVRMARPVLSCEDPGVFESAFYLMDHVDGSPIRRSLPALWASSPATHGRALEELIDALGEIHSVDWRSCGLGDLAHVDGFLEGQVDRWLGQLDSYGGRDLRPARGIADWLEKRLPAHRPDALCHGDYKLDNVLFAPDPPPRLLAVVDWEMAGVGDPLVDLAWALIFHPGPEGTMPLGRTKDPTFALESLPDRRQLIERYAAATGRDTAAMAWYDVFARWKLAVVLEGTYAKFLRGQSDKPMHEFFGSQVDLLLDSAGALIEQGATL